ncbi:peptidyl-prolyl cis-trans isomerase D (plasmid) [Legionella adelaidensis]|uniref:Periplasmic chaperone PpiD n=1 Tax=Legionella adelaidensis TaxID=45056 RepID=A0A0W0R2Z8_9GAMM|nr:SurA N-terminal domain-containing protein [Legionella adelaidensis]KTC65445.1 peptidyl-prolyl cis-trans isomerase D [Legionella adelaidensis]VEH84734.1 peptidyl-prolyl cis-trans isomerase D [Legionella adelaidensis]
MLQKLNERIQGVVAWVVIILIAVTFTLFGIDYYMQSRQNSNTQIEVNGQAISKDSFELQYRRTRQMRDPAQITAANENNLKNQVLDNMVATTVSLQAARANGFEVSPNQADAAIFGIPQFQEDGHFSADRYQQALSGAFYTPETFQKEIQQGMLLNQQRFAFIGTAFALPSEIKRFVRLYLQTRDYSYLTIPAFPFIKQVSVSEEEIKDYYVKNKQEFLTPEMVSVDYVSLSMQGLRAKLSVTDEQINRYYEENQSNYLTPAQWQVAHILFSTPVNASPEEQAKAKEKADKVFEELQKDPGVFEEKVLALSDDKISARNKGILPWITAGQSEFDKVLLDLTKPGEISTPVKSQHGYEIFKVVDYKPAVVKPLAEVQDQIKDELLNELAQTQYSQALEQMADLSYQSPDSLTPVAEALNLIIEHSQPFSREGGENEFTKNKQVINAAFSQDVLEMGNNSAPIQVDNDNVVVLRVNRHVPVTEKSLPEVNAAIFDLLAKQKAALAAKKVGEEWLKAGNDPATREKIIAENNLQWREVTKSSREGVDHEIEMINELAFNLPRAGETAGSNLDNGDYVIVQLRQINDGQVENLDDEQKASITQQIEATYGILDYDLYIHSLIAKAKIDKP